MVQTKTGGELTPAGLTQSRQFAEKFRNRLLQTSAENQQKFLWDMKVYMTEEIRVRKTAREFTRILLNKTEGECDEINQHLIEGKQVQHMLDDVSSVKGLIHTAKEEIQHIFYNSGLREQLLDDHYLPKTPHQHDSAFHFDERQITPGSNTGVNSPNSSNHLLLGTGNSDHINEIEKEMEILKQRHKFQLQQDMTLSRATSHDQIDRENIDHKEDIMDEKDLIEIQLENELIRPNSPTKPKHGDAINVIKNVNMEHNNQSNYGHDTHIINTHIDDAILSPTPFHLHHMNEPSYKLLPWAQRCLKQLQNPIKKCEELYEILLGVQRVLEENLNSNKQPYLDESPLVMKQRWDKIIEELYDKEKKQFDCSKIPDVFDSCRYDLLHNRHILRKLPLSRLWLLAELLASFVMPQEYGLSKEMKLEISRGVCKPLFENITEKIKTHCLKNNENTARTFLYFTSESYLHSLRNALILSDIPANKYVAADIEGMECSYFSHGVIRIYEDPEFDINSENRFYVDVAFSPGAYANPLIDVDQQVVSVEGCGPLNGRFPLNKFLKFLASTD